MSNNRTNNKAYGISGLEDKASSKNYFTSMHSNPDSIIEKWIFDKVENEFGVNFVKVNQNKSEIIQSHDG